MSTSKIQTGDKVKVTAGKYRGSVGTVTGTYMSKKRNGITIKRIRMSGIELQISYQKGFRAANMPGQMLSKERSLDASNVSLVDAKGVISKVKIDTVGGKKVRVLKKGGAQVVKEKAAKKEAEPKEAKKAEKKEKKTKK
jgi:large subunit ribosomal protein L24